MHNAQIEILGVKIDAVSGEEILEAIRQTIDRGEKEVFAYANIHAINLAQDNQWFRSFLNSSVITYPDSNGVQLGALILGKRLPASTALTRWIWRLAEYCSGKGYAIYLLGGKEGTAERAGQFMRDRFPNLKIAGFYNGHFEEQESGKIILEINAVKPQILLVGMGMPKQEEWIHRHRDALQVNVIFPAGAAIDFAAGVRTPAPAWIAGIGLEWLFRLVAEPTRLFRRYMIGNPHFIWNVFRQRMTAGSKKL
jgi:N-acetylglucosaminyldiphosphoundecaprenol N-acetyl-beta-D-mannosaminyltransferase